VSFTVWETHYHRARIRRQPAETKLLAFGIADRKTAMVLSWIWMAILESIPIDARDIGFVPRRQRHGRKCRQIAPLAWSA